MENTLFSLFLPSAPKIGFNPAMQESYVEILISEYLQRKALHPRYSERAFAQTLGLSPGFMKLLFQGKKRLSFERAKIISLRLNWNELKRRKFLSGVQRATSKHSAKLQGKYVLRDHDFLEISDWFHFAIIELIKMNRGKITAEQIASSFKLSVTEVSFALSTLEKMGMVEALGDGKYRSLQDYEMPSISSEGIRKFHRQVLELASKAIEAQPMDGRDLRALTLAFPKSRMLEAKSDIQKFVRNFEKKFGSSEGQKKLDSVYQLSLAFFQLDGEEL